MTISGTSLTWIDEPVTIISLSFYESQITPLEERMNEKKERAGGEGDETDDKWRAWAGVSSLVRVELQGVSWRLVSASVPQHGAYPGYTPRSRAQGSIRLYNIRPEAYADDETSAGHIYHTGADDLASHECGLFQPLSS